MLGIDRRTVASSAKSGELTNRVRKRLERALQYGVGSAAAEQQERNDKLEELLDKMEGQLKGFNRLEGRLDKMEGRVKDLREYLPSGLKRLNMSLDGVLRKYYGVQRRLIEERLLVLEASRGGMETGAYPDDES